MALEAALPGMGALSSAHAASRGSDGVCAWHGRHVLATAGCMAYTVALTRLRASLPSPLGS